jgi:hypothetical protein
LPDGLRRRAIIVAALALGLAVEWADCGSSIPSKGLVSSSDQQVTAVAVTAGGARPRSGVCQHC